MQNLNTPTSHMEPVRPNAAGFYPWLADGAHQVAIGNGRQYEVVIARGRAMQRQLGSFPMMVAVIGKGAYWFNDFVHGSYVCEKLGVPRDDAGNLADFINDQLSSGTERQGRYEAELTAEWVQQLYPVESFSAFSVSDDGDEVARVCISVLTEHGTAAIGAEIAKAATAIAEWSAAKLALGSAIQPPVVLGHVVTAGRAGSSDTATLGAEDYFGKRHAERVKGAL